MGEIAGVEADALHERLATTDDPKAVKRLMVALAYLDGVSVGTLSERYRIPQSTVYSWLDRFEERSVSEAIHDEDRPGRPPKLDADQRATLAEHVARSPDAFGHDDEEWTPELLRDHVERTFDVRYSVGHARRLLADLGAE